MQLYDLAAPRPPGLTWHVWVEVIVQVSGADALSASWQVISIQRANLPVKPTGRSKQHGAAHDHRPNARGSFDQDESILIELL